MSRLDRSWEYLAIAFAMASVAAWWMPANLLDWQPALAWAEPWRALTGAFVHWNVAHLGTNLLGTALVAALGSMARLPAPATLAWVAAWPLTQATLYMQPAIVHYGGLSGVLHAGVAVATLWLLVCEQGRRRALGAAIGVALLVKLLLEEPWGLPLRPAVNAGIGGTEMAVAPLAHAAGAVAGLVCAAVALVLALGRVRAPTGR